MSNRFGFIYFDPSYIFSDICGLSSSLVVSPPAELNEGDALPKCHQNAIKVTIYVKLILTFKEPMVHGTYN